MAAATGTNGDPKEDEVEFTPAGFDPKANKTVKIGAPPALRRGWDSCLADTAGRTAHAADLLPCGVVTMAGEKIPLPPCLVT